MADWANLPGDILISIAKRVVTCFEESVIFGFVCKGWSSVMTEETFGRLTQEIPWIMPSTYVTAKNIRRIYRPTKDKLYRFNLPKAHTKSCYSSQGWLMTVSRSDLEVELLNPLRPDQVKKLGSLKQFRRHLPIRKFVLSSSPSSSSAGCILMVLCDYEIFAFRRGRWTLVQSPKSYGCFHDMTYYKGLFYVVTSKYSDHVDICVVIEVMASLLMRKWETVTRWSGLVVNNYLVESAGDLLVVLQMSSGFRILKVEIPSNRTRSNGPRESEVKDLGSRSLFLGYNSSSFSVEVSDYSACKPNCIYFTRNIYGTWIFHVEDGKTEPIFVRECGR